MVVTNRFGDGDAAPHVKLLRVTFQNMFPAVNVANVRLRDFRRVVLFHYDEEAEEVDVRHYAIRADPVGVDRRVRRVLKRRTNDGSLFIICLILGTLKGGRDQIN